MSSVSFFYSFNDVLQATRKALKRNGYKIVEINDDRTLILAKRRFKLFNYSTLKLNIAADENKNTVIDVQASTPDPEETENIFLASLYESI